MKCFGLKYYEIGPKSSKNSLNRDIEMVYTTSLNMYKRPYKTVGLNTKISYQLFYKASSCELNVTIWFTRIQEWVYQYSNISTYS